MRNTKYFPMSKQDLDNKIEVLATETMVVRGMTAVQDSGKKRAAVDRLIELESELERLKAEAAELEAA